MGNAAAWTKLMLMHLAPPDSVAQTARIRLQF